MTTDLLAMVLGLAIAIGVSPYATVALLALAHQAGWLGALPAAFVPLTQPWVATLAVVLALIEVVATLLPGVASAWEALHAIIRPPAAILLALLVAWGGSPALVFAVALLSGAFAFGTALTKLGARLAVDTSPEPVSNGVATLGELGFIALILGFIFRHPVITALGAVVVVLGMALLVRTVWGLIWNTVTRSRRPGVRTIRS